MTKLYTHDVTTVLRRLPIHVRDQLKKVGPGLFVAGGFIRSCVANEVPSDIDLFSPSKHWAEAYAKELAEKAAVKIWESDNAFTVHLTPWPAQYIHRWTFERPEDAMASFDFTVAQAAIWWTGETWTSMCSERFYADLAARRLVYLRPQRNEDAGGSMLRVLKFYTKGYRIPLDSLGAVISRLVQGVKPDDESQRRFLRDPEWRDQLLTSLLIEVDPNSDPSKYIMEPTND